jgi:hypothetical protein
MPNISRRYRRARRMPFLCLACRQCGSDRASLVQNHVRSNRSASLRPDRFDTRSDLDGPPLRSARRVVRGNHCRTTASKHSTVGGIAIRPRRPLPSTAQTGMPSRFIADSGPDAIGKAEDMSSAAQHDGATTGTAEHSPQIAEIARTARRLRVRKGALNSDHMGRSGIPARRALPIPAVAIRHPLLLQFGTRWLTRAAA